MKKLLYICGPTLSGKTGFSLKLAEALPDAVFINADTMQLYKGLEPMAGHPSPEALSHIDHRLFGILSPEEPFSRSAWLTRAAAEIDKALAAGKQPILIGGSRSFAAELAKSAYGVTLEVDLNNAVTFAAEDGKKAAFPYDLHTLLLMPERRGLEDRIQKYIRDNTDAALEAVARTGYSPNLPAFWVFGAKEYAAVLEDKLSLKEAHDSIAKKTLDYALEQRVLFDRLEAAVRKQDPSKILRLTSMDNAERVRETLAYIQGPRPLSPAPRSPSP